MVWEKKRILKNSIGFLSEIPLLKIFMLKDLDRVNPVFWPVFFAFLFIVIGLVFSFFKLVFIGGFVLLFYFAIAFVFVWNSL